MRSTELRLCIKIVAFPKVAFVVSRAEQNRKPYRRTGNADDVGAITYVRSLLIQWRVRAVAEPVLRATPPFFLKDLSRMPQGTIKRKTDKGFGFIDTGTGKDMFFHSSN